MRKKGHLKGLNPKKMVVEKTPVHYGLPKRNKPKPKVAVHFVDKELQFQLEHFEDWCKNFSASYNNIDVSRCETILSLFVTFFKSGRDVFEKNEVDLSFFFDAFKKSDAFTHFRHVIQLRDEVLLDPLIYALWCMFRCDERFGAFFGELDFAACLLHAIKNFESSDKRVFTNVVNLFLGFLPYHYLCDEKFEGFVEVLDEAFAKLDAMGIPTSVKAEVLFLVVDTAEPMPDAYPQFLSVLLKPENLTKESLLFTVLAVAKMIEKDSEFGMIIRDLSLIDPFFDRYKEWECDDARYGILYFVTVLLDTFSDSETADAVRKLVRVHDIALAMNSTNPSLATVGFRVALTMQPSIIKKIVDDMGQFWLLIDAIVASMKRDRTEQITAALDMLAFTAKHASNQMIKFLNDDFNKTLVDLLKSDVEAVHHGVLTFFEVFLTTGDVSLSQLGSWCLEFEDHGGRDALVRIVKTKQPAQEHAEAVINKLESVERAHRNRCRS